MKILEASNLCKSYGKKMALQEASLSLEQGFVLGLIGPNGAGKTTLMKGLLDVIRFDSGEISLFGEKTLYVSPKIKQRIGFVHEQSYLFEDLSPADHERICRSAYTSWDAARFSKLLRRFDLSKKAKVKTFSKGMKMRCSLALALSHGAELIILDEPSSGLDPIVRRDLLDVIAEEMEQENRSFIISTHITSDLDRIADYITLLDSGKNVLNVSRNELQENWAFCRGDNSLLENGTRDLFIGPVSGSTGFTGITSHREEVNRSCQGNVVCEPVSIEDLMVHIIREKKQ